MPKKDQGEPPCRSCATLTVVLFAVLTGVLSGSGAGGIATPVTVPAAAVSPSS